MHPSDEINRVAAALDRPPVELPNKAGVKSQALDLANASDPSSDKERMDFITLHVSEAEPPLPPELGAPP